MERKHGVWRAARAAQEAGFTKRERKQIADKYAQIRREGALLLDQKSELGKVITRDHITAVLRVLAEAHDLTYTHRTNDATQLSLLNEQLRLWDERQDAAKGGARHFTPEDYKAFSWLNKLLEESMHNGTLVGLTISSLDFNDMRNELSRADEVMKERQREEVLEQVAVLVNRLAKIKEQAGGRKIASLEKTRLDTLFTHAEAFAERYAGAIAHFDQGVAEKVYRDYILSRDRVREDLGALGQTASAADLYALKHLLIAAHFMDRSGYKKPDEPAIVRLHDALQKADTAADPNLPLTYDFKYARFGEERRHSRLGSYGTVMHIRVHAAMYYGIVAQYIRQQVLKKS